MAKRKGDDGQIAINFSQSYLRSPSTPLSSKDQGNSVVVRFVDRRTAAVREEAVKRVRSNGIFRVTGDDPNP